jgi:nucleotide-binding universal stress UspA family protein
VLPRTIVSVLGSSDVVKDAAIAWAESLARWYESDLHVVHVQRSRRWAAADERARRDELVGRINRIADASGTGGVNVIPVVLSGRPVRAIAGYSRRVAADLVVVTNRARRRNGYWLAGSFAAALGKAAPSPTIVLPDGVPRWVEPGSPFRNIVSAIDFSDASLRAMSEALKLAQRSGGHLRLVHALRASPYDTVYGGAGASRLMPHLGAGAAHINRELRLLIPPDALNWSNIDTATVRGEARDGILTVASRVRADLIVLGLPRRSRFEELVAGTTVHGVLRRATSPVLLVPGPPTPPRFQRAEERALTLGLYPSALGTHR